MPSAAPAPALVVHGGAGSIADDRIEVVRAGLRRALAAGLDLLAGGGAALDAVQAAVRVLEDDPEFNAGVGAVLTRAGTVELDAAIMDGRELRVGAVGALSAARQPIDIARAVLEDGEHVLLCGEGAWAFARERGFSPCDPAALITERARERLAAAAARRRSGEAPLLEPGTVGACAIDGAGHLATATSTGGITGKRPGRIGDTPLPGCGTWADDQAGAASATGHGESIIRITMTRRCADLMAAGRPADAAAWLAVDELAARTGGEGGIICVDRAGRVGAAHNSPRMACAAGTIDAAGRPRDLWAEMRRERPRE